MDSTSYAQTIGENEKLCFDCKTSKTPLWRSGPAGPKSLCNACGIRFRKKRSTVGSEKKKEKEKEKQPPPSLPSPTSSTADEQTSFSRKREIGDELSVKNGDLMKKLRINVVAMGTERRRRQRDGSPVKVRVEEEEYRKKKKLGEVEEAAYLLMCLSWG